jgi:hypothetical protein
MIESYNFSRGGESQFRLEEMLNSQREEPADYEREVYNHVSAIDYVISIGDSYSRDLMYCFIPLGAGLAFSLINLKGLSFQPSILTVLSCTSCGLGIAKFFSSGYRTILVDQFNQHHAVRSFDRKTTAKIQVAPLEVEEKKREILTINERQYTVDDFIPAGWSRKQLRDFCQNVKVSGTFSEPGSGLHKDKYVQARDTFLNNTDESGDYLVAWKDPSNRKQGVKILPAGHGFIHYIATAPLPKKEKR